MQLANLVQAPDDSGSIQARRCHSEDPSRGRKNLPMAFAVLVGCWALVPVAYDNVKRGEASHGQPLAASRLGFQPVPRPNTRCVVQTRWKILSVPGRAFRMTFRVSRQNKTGCPAQRPSEIGELHPFEILKSEIPKLESPHHRAYC